MSLNASHKMYYFNLSTYLIIRIIPISNENVKFLTGHRERDGDYASAVDTDRTVPTRSLLEEKRGVIKEAPNLILQLKTVGPILPRHDWAVGPLHSVLP